jgi:dTDP-glucose 4,6-dehydratase
MRIAILGAGGCFALNFARHLEKLGIECFGIGRSGPKPAPFWLAPKNYRFWALHLVDQFLETLAILDTEKPDVIVNYAAQGEGAASFGANAPDFFRTNAWGLARVAWALKQRDYVKRFVHIGTSEAYGSVDHPAKEHEDGKATSPYGISKQAFDDYLKTLHRIHQFPMNIIRPTNAYVPGQQLYRVIPKAIVCALKGEKLPLQGGGKAQKSYIHSDDLSRAVMAVLEKGTVGKVYNCGPQGPISIRALVTHVAEACGISFEELVEEVPDRVGQDARYCIDSSELAKDTGWTQTVGLARGLEGMVRWVRDYPELLTMPTNYEHRV